MTLVAALWLFNQLTGSQIPEHQPGHFVAEGSSLFVVRSGRSQIPDQQARYIVHKPPRFLVGEHVRATQDCCMCLGELCEESLNAKTEWRSEGDSNARDPSGINGRNSARVWHPNRPE